MHLHRPHTNIFTKIILVLAVVMAVYVGQIVFFPHPIPNKLFRLVINKNENMEQIAQNLNESGVISHPMVFLKVIRLLGRDRHVFAGLYILRDSMSLWDIIARVTNGHPDAISVTFIDGWNFEELKQYIDGLPDLQHLSKDFTEKELRDALKIQAPNLEGLFYPSTYFIIPGQTDLELYQHAYKMMQQKVSTLYLNRSPNSYYKNPYQLLIMASLIQKETADKADMQLISTVFNNRLKIGMKLQDDPSVFYGLQDKKRIRRKDFLTDTPYNTYLHSGLPPTPICLPSDDALVAASQPLNQPKLFYFLAIGHGRTRFSKTYQEHQQHIRHYLEKIDAK